MWENRKIINVEIKSENANGFVHIPLEEAKLKNESLIDYWVGMFKETLVGIIDVEIKKEEK